MLRVRPWYLGAGLLVLTVLAYLPLWKNDFVDFDDELYITANPQVIRGWTGSGFIWAWTNCHAKYWQPITWLSLQSDAQFFSTRSPGHRPALSPTAFHLDNLCWHAGTVLLLFGLWHRLTGALWRSFLVAALFALHPMHVESVAWAAERKDVLSAFFGVLTLWAYVRYVDRPGWQRYLGVVAAFLLSLLAKPMLITLPLVLLLLDYWPLRRLALDTRSSVPGGGLSLASPALGRMILEKLPLLVVAAALAVVTVVAREWTGAAVSLRVLPLSARLANAATAYGWYVAASLCPARLAALYPHPYRHWSVWSALAGVGVLLALTTLCGWQARRRPWLVVGWLWFVGSLVPVIGLAQGGVQAWADRFSYWPHIGLFVAAAWGLEELAGRLRVPALSAGGAGALALGCLGVLTWRQVGYWRDTETLWQRALAVTRDNDRAHANLANFYLNRGRLDEAERHFAEAVRIQPDSSDYRQLLGTALLALGKVDEAAGQLREALERAPQSADAWHNLGVARLRQGSPARAVHCFRRTLDLRPGAADTLAGLGLALWREGKPAEAIEAFRAALRQDPGQADAWHGLGLVYLAQGKTQEAIEAFGQALQCQTRLVSVYSDLGLALGRQGQWDRAVACQLTAVRLQDEGEQALARMHGQVPAPEGTAPGVLFLCRLAFALNHLGDHESTTQAYRTALRRDPDWPRKFTAQAWRLATAPDAGSRDPRLACELASQAVQAAGDPCGSELDALAAAQAALGQFPDAVRTAQQALDKASAGGEAALARSIRERLRLYKAGKPAPAQSR